MDWTRKVKPITITIPWPEFYKVLLPSLREL